MSTEDIIRNCKFILDFQKEKLLDLLEEDRLDTTLGCETLIDIVFRKMFDSCINDLTTDERTMLDQAIKDYNG